MKTTTLGALVMAEPALQRLTALALPYKIAYGLKRVREEVRRELQYYQEERAKLIRELGADRDPTAAETAAGVQGPVTEVTKENTAAFLTRMTDLIGVDVTLSYVLTPAILESFQLSVDDLVLLEGLTESEEAAEPVLFPRGVRA
jgi:hypothetical protein